MQRAEDWPWYKLGLAGVVIVAWMTAAHLIAAIPRLFVEPWKWAELLLLPVQIIVIGFSCGATVGLLLPLRRWGMPGHAIIGAVAANVYLLGCIAAFAFDSLRHPRLSAVIGLASVAAIGGGWFGALLGWEIQRDMRNEARTQGSAEPRG